MRLGQQRIVLDGECSASDDERGVVRAPTLKPTERAIDNYTLTHPDSHTQIHTPRFTHRPWQP